MAGWGEALVERARGAGWAAAAEAEEREKAAAAWVMVAVVAAAWAVELAALGATVENIWACKRRCRRNRCYTC
jgi:hypothetical protein